MNVYVCIRTILHSLLFLVNVLALTVASLTIATLKGQGHKATAGSVLTILGFIFYVFVMIGIWSEACIPRSRLSTSRTETIVLPILFVFQIIGAIVATADAAKGTCHGQSPCIALLILSWMSAFTLLVYYFVIMIVTFYHYSFNENIWNESALGYNWFPMPPSDSVLPGVPPKDTNLIPNPPRETSRSPSIEISSIEPPPPSFPGRHRRQVSSWMPLPLDPDAKKRGIRMEIPHTQFPPEIPNETQPEPREAFEDVPIGEQAPRLPEPETTPKFSLNEYISRFSFGGPQWAKKLRPMKRGVNLPFPVTSTTSSDRHPVRVWDQPDMGSFDAPVSPSSYTE